MNRFTRWVSELVNYTGGGLRQLYRVVSGGFFNSGPAFDQSGIDYDTARQLYRNDGGDTMLGAGFCRPIIDRAVEFMGIPQVSSDDEETDNLVNEAIDRYWKPQVVEMFRNSMRDSITYVRLWQPLANDPLVTDEERRACTLTLIEPERITITWDKQNPKRMAQAIIVSKVEWTDPVQPDADPPRGVRPQIKEHEIWEIITPDSFKYYDRTDRKWLTDWARANPDNFVPIVAAWNEYDSALSGGQSDLESVFPFVKAFHEVLRQSLQAHGYHSLPKLKFKVSDIVGFLRANFPDTIDENTMLPKANATIPWRGREVLFMAAEDDIEFLEVKSILGDSKTLLEFLIDCISIASETPEELFMRSEQGASQSGDKKWDAYEKRIERKRACFQEPIQELVKMMLAMNGKEPRRPDIFWQEISVDKLVTLSQSIQQLVMSFEVLLERKLISENTAREALRQLRIFKTMKSPSEEAADAENNLSLDVRNAELDMKATEAAAKALPAAPAKTNGVGPASRVPAFSGRNKGGTNE